MQQRQIKFRLRLVHRLTSKVVTAIYTLPEIEQGALSKDFDADWGVITRDEFTGLLDKNGKEIYEGDIVRTRFGSKQVIEFQEFSGGGCEYGVEGYGVVFHDDGPEEVIGNIHEHEHLLSK